MNRLEHGPARIPAALCAAAVLALAAACGDHDHPHPHGAADGDHGPPGEQATHLAGATELFVEFPRLVRGENAEFVAHLTRLADFKPVAEGRLVVALSGGGHPEEQGETAVSDPPGIFRPELAPLHAGKRRIVFRLEAPGLRAEHDLGEFEVYADAKAAAAAPPPAERAGTIRYTKEDQWRTDFAVEATSRRPVRESIVASGLLRARAGDEAFVVAPAAGTIAAGARIPQIGEPVRRGEVLAFLVPRLAGERDAATLDLAVRRARVELDYARRERERVEALFRVEAVAERRVLEARSRESLARAELDAAERRAAPFQGAAGGIPLRAPIDGIVAVAQAAAGGGVGEGQTLFHIVRLDRLWLEARVPEGEAARLAGPVAAEIAVDGGEPLLLEPGRNARLVGSGSVVDPVTRTVPIVFEFDNPGRRLRVGTAVRVRLYTGAPADRLAVPAAAVVDDQGQPVVYVQAGGESFVRRPVETGTRDGDWLAIAAGLEPGERIVTRGAYRVRLAAAAPATAGHGHTH
jgi:RND family efflux transporter MFP subunit